MEIMQTRAPLHNKTSREKHTTPQYNIQKTIETLVSTLQHTQQRTTHTSPLQHTHKHITLHYNIHNTIKTHASTIQCTQHTHNTSLHTTTYTTYTPHMPPDYNLHHKHITS